MNNKKWFLGWTNIRWGLGEYTKIFSNKPSFFSKKRIESAIAFTIAQFGMVYFLILHMGTMTASDIVLWSSIEFTVAGYMVSQIQREKRKEKNDEDVGDDNGEENKNENV